ncbi:kinase-like domain-containing protein [Dendryphion nanum]|uniref:Kinase-like domain-containing protein n=1 Tax=Dendryphion nanum TaxID=256645 RepID=A0A9P9I826_9PLEO|nr:kinase-like domain-containing protein [Dendryphion nanum]
MRQPIDVASFTEYVRVNVPLIQLPLGLKQFSHGQSNPTYELTSATGQKYVLRKKPPGELVSKSAHRIEREYQVLKALEYTDVPVPKTYCLCEDVSIIGTPFYIMEFLDGRIFEDPWLPDLSPAERHKIWKEATRTLGKLHRVDMSTIGLSGLKKPSKFYTRQVQTLHRTSVAQARVKSVTSGQEVGELPHHDELVAFFSDEALQPTNRKTLVHGDFKLDNLVFDKVEARVIGILDWEMVTEGHPLSDLVNMTSPLSWSSEQVPMLVEQSLTEQLREIQHKLQHGNVRGIPTVEECYKWYQSIVEWDPRDGVDWALAFGNFRTAVIMQGIAARLAMGQASGIKAKEYALQTLPYALWSHSRIRSIKNKRQLLSKI